MTRKLISGGVYPCLIYMLGAQIGLLLATPLGAAAAVWPPAGIALGWLLVQGSTVLPAVFIGSFITNILIKMQTGHLDSFLTWLEITLLAFGSFAQAWVGGVLVRRYTPFPSALDESGSISRFLVFGGLISTLVNPTISTIVLILMKSIALERFWQNWFTWWIGDSIGVILFMPLIVVLANKYQYFDWRRMSVVATALLSSFVLTLAGFWLIAILENNDRVSRFHASSAIAINQLQYDLEDCQRFSFLVQSFFHSSEWVSRNEFENFVSNWLIHHNEVAMIGWAVPVNAKDRPLIENSLAEGLGVPFTIRDYASGHGNLPIASERRNYLPLLYTVPNTPNLLGVDLSVNMSSPVLEQVQPYMTSQPQPWWQYFPDLRAVMYTPIHWSHEHDFIAGDSSIQGVLVIAIEPRLMMQRLIEHGLMHGLQIKISTNDSTLFGSEPTEYNTRLINKMGLHYQSYLTAGVERWQVDIWPDEKRMLEYETWLRWTVLAVGILVNLLVVNFVLLNTGRRQYLLRTINERTQELQQRNIELDEARRMADQANKAKGFFLASMSHEIRTPMNAIIGFGRLLSEGSLSEREKSYVDKINNSSKVLLNLINDILDWSKVEAGRLEIESIEFNLEDVFRRVAQQVSLLASGKNVELIIDIPPDIPMNLYGDPLRLGQVLLNLTNNAIKFTEQGFVMVLVRHRIKTKQDMALSFWVIDTGIGISPEQQQRLFQPFEQADGATSRRFGGTGLGLNISHRLVELMGGELQLTSVPQQGTTFLFELLFKLQAQQNKYPRWAGLRVLVVDDMAESLRVIVALLQFYGCLVSPANSATEALAWLQTDTSVVDVVLIDWQMPDMDGLTLGRQILATKSLKHTPQLVLLIDEGNDLLRQSALDMGFVACLEKPVMPTALNHLLKSLLTRPSKKTIIVEDKPTKFKAATLLLVEDNMINQRVAVETLNVLGLKTVVAQSGLQALKLLQERRADFSLILLDIQMPEMDGFETAQRIREQWSKEALPIIALTAHALASDRERCLAVGMNDHVAKPIDINALIRALTPFLQIEEEASTVVTTIDKWALQPELIKLRQLLQRNSFDARRQFESIEANLRQLVPHETDLLAKALARLDFRQSRSLLEQLGQRLELTLT